MKAKIIGTLWIIFLTLMLGTIVLGLISEIIDMMNGNGELEHIFQIGILGSIFSFFTYGILIWPLVLLVMFFIELIGLNNRMNLKEVKFIFIVEWLLIASPFIIWAITENYLTWFYFILILAIGQYLRLKYIELK